MNRAYEKLCNYTQQCPVTFGVGSIATVKDAMGMLGAKKLFVVYDQGVKMSGLAEKVTKSLDEQGVDYITYDDITAEPVEDVVDKAYEVAKEAGCDGVLGLGGGSPMDVAKAVGVVAKFGGTIGDYEGVGKVPGPIDTLIAVPTTAGTGSEVTVAAVITDEARNYKLSVLGPEISPTYAVLDPELIMTAPASGDGEPVPQQRRLYSKLAVGTQKRQADDCIRGEQSREGNGADRRQHPQVRRSPQRR